MGGGENRVSYFVEAVDIDAMDQLHGAGFWNDILVETWGIGSAEQDPKEGEGAAGEQMSEA